MIMYQPREQSAQIERQLLRLWEEASPGLATFDDEPPLSVADRGTHEPLIALFV